jgi:hypothetical protein
MNDEELFDSVTSHEQVEGAEQVQAETATEATEQTRDEQGRFAAQTEQAQEQAGQAAQVADHGDDAQVPSWRMRELREERDAALRRSQETEQRLMRQITELQGRLPKQEAAPAPDVFEDPNKFLEHGVSQAVNPIKSEMAQLREFYSRREAIREFGQEKVDAAYQAIAAGMQSRDPEVAATYQRAMQSMDPFGDIVRWHQQKSIYQQIGADGPEAWFNKQLEERLAKDPAFQAKLLGQAQQQVRGTQGAAPNVVKLPPSLNKVGSATSTAAISGDVSDSDLFEEVTNARR